MPLREDIKAAMRAGRYYDATLALLIAPDALNEVEQSLLRRAIEDLIPTLTFTSEVRFAHAFLEFLTAAADENDALSKE